MHYQFAESIEFLKEQGIIAGYDDGTFKPNNPISRAEFSKIVMRAVYYDDAFADHYQSCFPDVPANQWYTPYVCLAKQEGVISGFADGTFKPAQNITQAEALKILYEAIYGSVAEAAEDGDFEEWYEPYFTAAQIDGMNYFNETAGLAQAARHIITRGEMSYFTAWQLDLDWTLSDQITTEFFTSQAPVSSHADSEALEWYVLYEVTGDTITVAEEVTNNDPELLNQQIHQNLWQEFTQLIPDILRSSVTEFVIYDSVESDAAAYVTAVRMDLSEWQLAINLDGTIDENGELLNPEFFYATLIHEFAHLFSLEQSQVDPFVPPYACPRFFTGEGCARERSLINEFYERFWTDEMFEIIATNRESGAEELYNENPEDFVTEYAATKPGEDFAESFTFFVLSDRPVDCSESALISSQKACFFYEYEGFPVLRDVLREVLQVKL